MKVVVIGGAGAMGSALSADLAACDGIEELVVADADGARAIELVERTGSPFARAAVLDVEDRRAALDLLGGARLLVNCTSFTLFDRVFSLAVEARVDYCDLISEPSPGQRRAAEEAGITAVSGLGASPGLTNVLVAHAAEAFDVVEEAHVSWASFRTIAPSRGLLDTILWELAGSCPTRRYYQNGRYLRAGAMEGSRLVDFALPLGRQRVYYVPHPEVTTLPRNFPSLRFCAVRGTWRPELMEHVRVLDEYGLLEPAALEATKRAIWARKGGVTDDEPWRLFVNVEVVGLCGEEPWRRVYDASHPDWGQEGTGMMTGICAAVGAELLARGGGRAAGFVDPELAFDGDEFLGELARRGTVQVSWRDERLEEDDGAEAPGAGGD
jgi:saccharopine dehydrogenase (NAD+, L-lysine-forming)